MAHFLLEDRDIKGFWIKIWNAGVFVITRSNFSSLTCSDYVIFVVSHFIHMMNKDESQKHIMNHW